MHRIIINDKLQLFSVGTYAAFIRQWTYDMIWQAQFDSKQWFLWRCQCGQCQSLDTEEECICCREIDPAAEVQCITHHEGF